MFLDYTKKNALSVALFARSWLGGGCERETRTTCLRILLHRREHANTHSHTYHFDIALYLLDTFRSRRTASLFVERVSAHSVCAIVFLFLVMCCNFLANCYVAQLVVGYYVLSIIYLYLFTRNACVILCLLDFLEKVLWKDCERIWKVSLGVKCYANLVLNFSFWLFFLESIRYFHGNFVFWRLRVNGLRSEVI